MARNAALSADQVADAGIVVVTDAVGSLWFKSARDGWVYLSVLGTSGRLSIQPSWLDSGTLPKSAGPFTALDAAATVAVVGLFVGLTNFVEAVEVSRAVDNRGWQTGRIVPDCDCHLEGGASHDLCCGHREGRNPDCALHGDGSRS